MNLKNQGQRPAEILVKDLELGFLGDVGRKDAAIGTHDGVTFWRGPETKTILAVPPVHHSELRNVIGAREYRV